MTEGELTYGCYGCQQFEVTDDREAYRKHCLNTHPDGKITTRNMPMRNTTLEKMPLIRLPCPFCEFIDVTPSKIEEHIETTHSEYIVWK